MDTAYGPIGDQFFTEDNVLIYNIKMVVPKHITIHDVKEYFEKFGKVSNVLVENRYNDRLGKSLEKYVVQYLNPKAAARVLRKPYHDLKNQSIRVVACSSLVQPDGEKLIKQINENLERNLMEKATTNCCKQKEASIFTLNDDCLEYICKYLSLADQINFAISCQRFFAVFTVLSKIQYKTFYVRILNEITSLQLRIFLQIVGPQIKVVKADFRYFDCDDVINQFLGMFLTNVVKLKVIGNVTCILSKLIVKMELLQELELIRCDFEDNFLENLKTFKNLKSLTVCVNHSITGSQIHTMTGLEKLILFDCPEIFPHLRNICKSLTNLNYLDIRLKSASRYYKASDGEHYKDIAKHLLQLETLKIDCVKENFKCLPQLPKLKVLAIKFFECNLSTIEDFFQNLAKCAINQLEELSIRSHHVNLAIFSEVVKLKKLKVLKYDCGIDDECVATLTQLPELQEVGLYDFTRFTNEDVLKLLKNCLNLRKISLRSVIFNDTNLISKSYKLLQEQRNRGLRSDCVHFVFDTRIYHMEEDCEISEFSDILKITS